MSDYNCAKAICPYYKQFKKQEIICEGIIDNTAIHIGFGNVHDLRRHVKKYCCHYDYEKCPVAKMLTEKYDEK